MTSNQSNHWVFNSSKIVANKDKYLSEIFDANENSGLNSFNSFKRIEPRARSKDFANALSFEVFDPLWMLTRQWQFGRFQGNDCGSIVTSKVWTSRRRLDSIYPRCISENRKAYDTGKPMEYDVEKSNKTITPFIRIESALHFKKMIELEMKENKPNGTSEEIILELMKLFCLEEFIPSENEKKTIETLKIEQNNDLKRLYAIYGERIFDGYKLFTDITEDSIIKLSEKLKSFSKIVEAYRDWFYKKYLPVANGEENCWNERKLGYEVAMGEHENKYEAEDYHTGRLSWYSFDAVHEINTDNEEIKLLSYLPVPATFPSAPSRLLWEFEDENVQLGQISNNDFMLLANAVVMQYVTVYGNDWMIAPIEAETGTILDVKKIIVTDTFGERILIEACAQENPPNDMYTFNDFWNLFGNAKLHAYTENDFRTQKGLLFPPTVRRCEESKPIEEVQFLRDEMANMLWGVETIINNGCDGTVSGKDLSDAVLAVVDAGKKESPTLDEEYEYSFLVQNRVPIHWIPFIPQQIKGQDRDIQFRRGRMPIFFNEEYNSVRPSTELLKYARETERKDIDNPLIDRKRKIAGKKKNQEEKVIPRFINEEEITGYGVKLVLTAKRTRWFLGKSFTWTGATKVISQYQANSGLMFDELINKEDKKPIKLKTMESINFQGDTEKVDD